MCLPKKEPTSSQSGSCSTSSSSPTQQPPPAKRTKFRETTRTPGGALGVRRAASTACLDFADYDWLLDVPPPAALRTAGDLQRAVARAVEGFLQLQRRRDGAATTLAAEDAMSATSDPSEDHDTGSETEASSADIVAASVGDVDKGASPFEQEVLRDMGWDLYYASLAEALLMEPPATSSDASCCEDGDCDDVSGVPLWTY